MGAPDPFKVSLEQPPQAQPMGEDDAFLRRKKTLNLLIAGLVVLLLPLLGIVFIMRNKANDGSSSISSMYLFQKRKGAEAIVPVTTAAPNKASMSQSSLMMPSEGAAAGSGVQSMQGGLSFIRGGEDYAEEAAAPPAPAESEKKVEKKEEPPPQDAKAQLGVAPAELPPPPKMVERPKLKFTGRSEAGSFAKPRMSDNIQSKAIESQAGATGPGGAAGAGGSSGGGSTLGGGGMPTGGMPDMSQMMKNMPGGGAGMPDMSQMMKNMPGGGAGMPDMSQMMKNMPGGGAGMPDMSQMMKNMPGGAAPAADTKTKAKTKKKTTTSP